MIYMRGHGRGLRSLAAAWSRRLGLGTTCCRISSGTKKSFPRRKRRTRRRRRVAYFRRRGCVGICSMPPRRAEQAASIPSPTSTAATTKAPAPFQRQSKRGPALVVGRARSSSRCCIAPICGSRPAVSPKASSFDGKRAAGVRLGGNGVTRSALCRGEVMPFRRLRSLDATPAVVRHRSGGAIARARHRRHRRPARRRANLQDHLQLRLIYKVDGITHAQ